MLLTFPVALFINELFLCFINSKKKGTFAFCCLPGLSKTNFSAEVKFQHTLLSIVLTH